MSDQHQEPIDQEWVRHYVDTLLEFARTAGHEPMAIDAALLRADHAMDLVQAWRSRHEHKDRP